MDGVRKRYSWRGLIGVQPSNGAGASGSATAWHTGTAVATRLAAVRVLIFHGYLLRGTGSNVYNAALAEAFARGGHEVHLLCQDRAPLDLPWVDAAGDWDGGALELDGAPRPAARDRLPAGHRRACCPSTWPTATTGVEARPFPDLSDDEVADYVERNVAAVARGRQRASGRTSRSPTTSSWAR